MSGNLERPTVDTRSVLAAEVNLDFECSYAAAEANKAAYALLDSRQQQHREYGRTHDSYRNPKPPEPSFVQVVGEDLDVRRCEVIGREWHGISADQSFSLAVIQPVQTTHKKVLSRVLKRQIGTEAVEARDEPILVAKFEDVALPLATFARRKDGQCSYVQIGAEIKDDNFHVLATDDSTGRNVVIEAIRDLLDPKHNVRGSRKETKEQPGGDDERRKEVLLKLIGIEVSQNREKLADAFEAQLVRKSFEEFDPKYWRRLLMVHEGEGRYEGRYNLRPLVKETLLPDGRLVELAIARPIDSPNQDIAHIVAISRGQVAMPVAALNASTGKITFDNPELATDSQHRQEVVNKLLSILRGNPLVQHDDIQFAEYPNKRSRVRQGLAELFDRRDSKFMDAIDSLRVPETLRREVGIVGGLRITWPISRIDRAITACVTEHGFARGIIRYAEVPEVRLGKEEFDLRDEARSNITAFLEDPDNQPNPYPHSKVLEVAVRRLNKERQAQLNVINQFDVQARLAEILGPTTIQDERLVKRIFNMTLNSRVHRGVIKDVDLGPTIADIDFKVAIEWNGPNYQITVSRKPAAMEDEALRISPAFCFSYDVTQPIAPQLNGTREHMREVINYFRQLRPVKPQKATK
jgi:hypothetical protein